MGDETGQPPGGGGYQDRGGGGGGVNGNMSLGVERSETQKKNGLYSDRLKTHVRYDQRLKRNVLEITLEKTNNDAVFDDVNEEAVGRVLKHWVSRLKHRYKVLRFTTGENQCHICVDGGWSQPRQILQRHKR